MTYGLVHNSRKEKIKNSKLGPLEALLRHISLPYILKNSLLKFYLNFRGLRINHEENTNVALAFSKNESINEKFCHWGEERKGKR